jgi:hypothetical protein
MASQKTGLHELINSAKPGEWFCLFVAWLPTDKGMGPAAPS